MQHSSESEATRGQVYPIPALVAVLTLTLALTAYANVAGTVGSPAQPSPAVPALKQVEAAATNGALLDPGEIDHDAAGLDGYRVNVSLRTPTFVDHWGPEPPDDASQAKANVAVYDANSSNVAPGTLSVEVWPWTEG